MIPEKSQNYDLPNSYENIEQTLITADQILSDAVQNAKTLFHSPTISSLEDSKIVSRVMVLREFDLKKRFIALCPDAEFGPAKRWPTIKWLELAESIQNDFQVVFIGLDNSMNQDIMKLNNNNLLNLIGKTSLDEVLKILQQASCVVANDSGLMHIAAAAGAPTLGLFGPSREAHYAPWGSHTAVVRTARDYDELVGGPDYDHRTVGSLMVSLSVDMAEAGARELWGRVLRKSR